MKAIPENETALSLVTKLQVNSSNVDKHLDWLTRLMMQGIESTEALSAEIFPPSIIGTTEWILVQRFHTIKQIEAWQTSNEHRRLMDELTPYLNSQEVAISESIDTRGSISVAVVTHVKEGQEKPYFAYEKRYQSAQAKKPGYCGVYVQPPTGGATGTWITIIRFDSPKSMDQWFLSEERKQLVAESNQLISSTGFQNVTTSFPGWFTGEAGVGKGPPNWKTAMLILLGLYPSVMLVIKYLIPLMHAYSPAVNNFIGNILTVAFTTWITMPLFIKTFNSWLFPNQNTPKWINPLSVITILFLFAIEIAFFWRFF